MIVGKNKKNTLKLKESSKVSKGKDNDQRVVRIKILKYNMGTSFCGECINLF